jgi:hypothetical protein
MKKKVIFALFWVGVLCAWPMASGCHEHKTRVIQRSDTIQESDPQMVSPGKEKVE